jgi:hypothetical protein
VPGGFFDVNNFHHTRLRCENARKKPQREMVEKKKSVVVLWIPDNNV